MLTRLEVNGFKNLVDFSLDFGPYTCIAGPNGAGKSNIFDAVRFLSLLTEHPINEAALRVRSSGEETGEIADLFFSGRSGRRQRMEFAAEMIVDGDVSDDLGRQAKASSSFLRYEVSFRYEPPSSAAGPLGGLVLEREALRPIIKGEAKDHLKFPHSAAKFRDPVVYNTRRASSGFISTSVDDANGQTTIEVHQDGGSRGQPRPAAAQAATHTIIGTERTVATPTILAARREMQSWRVLALEPSAMRRPDRYTQAPGIAANGAHIPATLQHLANPGNRLNGDADPPDDILGRISSRLSTLIPVQSVRPVPDDVRQLFSLEIEDSYGVRLRANSISDGALRFLALLAIAESADATGVFCMEEPENGIHPAKLPDMNGLLHDIAVAPDEAVAKDNPLRQMIVATHSPYFVQLQNSEDLVLVKNPAVRGISGEVIRPLRCYPLQNSWRDRGNASDGGKSRGVGMLELQSYLMPPEGIQLQFPPPFWPVAC